MDVHQIERHSPQEPLESAADVEGKRRRPPAWAARQGDALTNGKNPRVLPLQHCPRILPGLSDQAPALTNRRPGLGRRDDQSAMPAPRKLLGSPPNELVDLMPAPPRMGTDLSNGKRFARAHRGELREAGTGGRVRRPPCESASTAASSRRLPRPAPRPALRLGLRLGLGFGLLALLAL